MKKLWKELEQCGSGFRLEAERDYEKKNKPMIYRLRMFGLYYPGNYEIVGHNIEELVEQVIKEYQANKNQNEQQ